jgi:hypothetical protein
MSLHFASPLNIILLFNLTNAVQVRINTNPETLPTAPFVFISSMFVMMELIQQHPPCSIANRQETTSWTEI